MNNINLPYDNLNALSLNYILLPVIISLFSEISQQIVKSLFHIIFIIYTTIVNIYKKKFWKITTLTFALSRDDIDKQTHEYILKITQIGLAFIHYLNMNPQINLQSLNYSVSKFIPSRKRDYIQSNHNSNNKTNNYRFNSHSSEENTAEKAQHDYSASDDIYLENNIYANFIGVSLENGSGTTSVIFKTSDKITKLKKFIQKIEDDYKNYQLTKKEFVGKILTVTGYDEENNMVKCMETNHDLSNNFDNLFFENKEKIINQLKNLNVESNKKFKKKVSLMLHGLPGSGKSAVVQAIAQYTKRCIIYITTTQLGSSNEYLFDVMYGKKYNDYIINNDEKIIFFDEIDAMSKNIAKSMKKISNILI